MTVVSAAVEANGWVFAVRGTWSATPGSWDFGGSDRVGGQFAASGVNQFPLDADGTPKLVLNVQDAGYDRIGGAPVANGNRPRTVVATKPLRRAWPNQTQLDEIDHGDGTRTIRFALSDRIYSDSAVVSASFLTDWKVGQGGGVISTIANNSTRAAPLPIFRWANEPWPLVQGTVGTPNHTARVELIIASHHPEHFGIELHQACAAVRFRAFDGTTFKEFWFSSAVTSTLYGDNLRCWGGDIDLSGLSAGPITVHATVYPWVGVARETGNSHVISTPAALATAWGAPFHLYYDPTGTAWPRKYVAVDPASTNTGPTNSTHLANVLLYDSPEDALAAPVANKPGTVSMAVGKFGSANVTLTGRNGYSNVNRCCGWWEIILPAGTSAHSTAVGASTGANAGQGYLIFRGDPDDADPRANCVMRAWRTSDGAPNNNGLTLGAVDRVKFRDMTLALGGADMFSNRTNSWATMENVSIRSEAGQAAFPRLVYNSQNFTSQFNTSARDIAAGGQLAGFLHRNVQRTANISSSAIAAAINVTINTPAPGDHAPDRTLPAFGTGTANTNDCMIWGCKAYGWVGDLFSPNGGVFGSGTATFRMAVVNTLYEGGAVNGRILQIGETNNTQMRDSIFEGVTLVGGRFNLHNDSDLAGTVSSNAFRVNQGTTITVGVMAHGLSTGDTITTSGSSNGNLNRTNTAVTVLDANRFTYVAGGSVTAVPGTLPTITVTSGARNGDVLTLLRDNLRQTGNVIRYCSFDRNATKHDIFNSAPNLTGSWEVLYGVGFRGNVNANRGTASPGAFQYAYYGLQSQIETNFGDGTLTGVASYGVNWFGYVSDNSVNGPDTSSATYNGDYRPDTITAAPFKPSRLLDRGTAPAVIDRTGSNTARGATFDGGALVRATVAGGTVGLALQDGVLGHFAASAAVGWVGRLVGARAVSPVSSLEAILTVAVRDSATPGRVLRVEAEARGLRVGIE